MKTDIQNLILDLSIINETNSNSFKNELVEENSLIHIGRFIEKYCNNDFLYKILSDNISEEYDTLTLYNKTEDFLKNYLENKKIFDNKNKQEFLAEFRSFYQNYVDNYKKLKLDTAEKDKVLYSDLLHKNDTYSVEERQLLTNRFNKADSTIYEIENEIRDIEYLFHENTKYLMFDYSRLNDIVLYLNNQLKIIIQKELNDSSIDKFENINLGEEINIIDVNFSTHDNSEKTYLENDIKAEDIKTNLSKNLKEVEVYFDMYILGGIYKIYNNVLFEPTDEDTFRDFFNLIESSTNLIIKKQKKYYIHHLINELYLSLDKSEKSVSWRSSILNKFGWNEAEHSRRYNTLNRNAENKDKKAINFCDKLNLILNKG